MTIDIASIEQAAQVLGEVIKPTPLQYNKRLSKKFGARVYLKREDLQEVRSYKIRGAYNKISGLKGQELKSEVVCASAGNHAQGVAWSCAALKIAGVIFMPVTTPNQKLERVRDFGGKYVRVELEGNTFDEAYQAAYDFSQKKRAVFVHPFNDPDVIAGQGTIAKEICDDLGDDIDLVIVPIGGGGLISGVASYIKNSRKQAQIIGVEPRGAAAMTASLNAGKLVTLESIDTFVDGCAVKREGELTFALVSDLVKKVLTVPEGQVCTTMVELYQNEGIITEPAGALAISALTNLQKDIKGKTVVCIVSGGNNDILRYPEILEKSLIYQGRKHYFIIEFAQKPGQLKKFVNHVLSPTDDIVRFEYIKKTNKEKGPALVGIELAQKEDYQKLIRRMEEQGISYRVIKSDDLLYEYIV